MYGLHWKQNRSILLTMLLAGALVAPLAIEAQTDAAPASAATSAPPSDAELAGTQCAIGEERFLPGDYYYCLGTQTYGQQHYTYALKFFTTAASWGSKPAQFVLGIMALNGDHQPVSRPLALAWLALAAERQNSNFKGAYDAITAKSSADDLKAAAQLLVTMRPIYADATAAVRAEKRYAEGMVELNRLASGNSRYCMAGMTTLAQPAVDPTQCPPIQTVAKALDTAAFNVFDGWSGHVSVGPLEQVKSPAEAVSSKQ